MSQMLASDLNNPAFVGAMNPDSLLHAEFYWHEPEDWNKTQETGKLVRLPKQIYVRIMRPGDNTSIIETPIREEHKARWPDKWLYFQMKEGLIEGGGDIPGWKVEEWNFLNPEQVRELKFLRFSTVEQIAGASDAQVQKLGIGGLGLREQARQALRARMGAETRDAMAEKDREIAEMRARMEKLEALIMQRAAPHGNERAGAQGNQTTATTDRPAGSTPDAHAAAASSERDLLVGTRTEEPKPYEQGFYPVPTAPQVPASAVAAGQSGQSGVTQPAVAIPSEREVLVAQYVAKHGKKPHHKLSVEKIRAALA